jgi:ketosteroid isomerase-like protein
MLEALVQRRFEALNRRDLRAIVAMWNKDGVFEFPGKTPVSGRFEGIAAIEAWWRRWVERYARVHFTVRHVGIAGVRPGAQVLLVAWDVDVTTKDGISGQASAVSLMKARAGKIAYAKDYFFDPTVLEKLWGRVDEEDASDQVLVSAVG